MALYYPGYTSLSLLLHRTADGAAARAGPGGHEAVQEARTLSVGPYMALLDYQGPCIWPYLAMYPAVPGHVPGCTWPCTRLYLADPVPVLDHS